MKIVDVRPKDIYVLIELPIQEIDQVIAFCDKAIPLYAKVHSDSNPETGEFITDVFVAQLKDISDQVKKGM